MCSSVSSSGSSSEALQGATDRIVAMSLPPELGLIPPRSEDVSSDVSRGSRTGAGHSGAGTPSP